MKRIKFHLIVISILFLTASVYSQTIVKSQIIDSATLSPIPFILVQLSITKTTSISNIEGFFNINISNKNTSDTVIISSLGYKTNKIPVNDLLKSNDLKISLAPNPISLLEVTVKPIKITELLNTATKISSAKFQSSIMLNGYYREVVKTDDSISKYADGLLTYYLQRDKKNRVDISIKVNQSRVKEIKTVDDDKFDGFESKIPISKLAEFIEPITSNVLDSNNFKYYDYQIGEVNQGLGIYVIRFKPKTNIDLALYEGTIQIDKASNLILGMDYKFSPTVNYKVIKSISMLGIKLSLTSRRTIVKYNLKNNNYYPAYVFINGGLTIESKKLNQTNEFRSEFIADAQKPWNTDKIDGVFKKKYLFQNGNNYSSKFWESLSINPNTLQELDFLKETK